MVAGVQNAWSTTPVTNGTADSGINAAEGQAPSTLNDSLRGVMASVKKWFTDTGGSIVTGGTSTAYTVTTNEVLASLVDGMRVTVRLHATNGAAPTLKVDSTAAVAIQAQAGSAVGIGMLLLGGVYEFVYYASGNVWIAVGIFTPAANKFVGEVFSFAGSSVPALSLFCRGQAVSRTTYAALFVVIGTTYGTGDGSTTFNVPDAQGRTEAGLDAGATGRLTSHTGGVDGTALGAVGGEQAHSLVAAENGPHTHGVTGTTSDPGNHTHTLPSLIAASASGGALSPSNSGSGAAVTGGSGAHTHTVTGTADLQGSGTAHNNVQPTIVLNKCIFAGV